MSGEGRRTICWSLCSCSFMWGPGNQIRSSGLETGFTLHGTPHWPHALTSVAENVAGRRREGRMGLALRCPPSGSAVGETESRPQLIIEIAAVCVLSQKAEERTGCGHCKPGIPNQVWKPNPKHEPIRGSRRPEMQGSLIWQGERRTRRASDWKCHPSLEERLFLRLRRA